MDIDTLIVKYLDWESTLEEIDEVNRWRKSAPENESIFCQSEEAWRIAHVDRMYVRLDKRKIWKNIQKKIARRYSLSVLVRVAGIAAFFALVMGMALSYTFTRTNNLTREPESNISQQPQTVTLNVPRGIVSKTILPDNTVVWLNSSSTISYPSYFEGNTRTVELIGEAFFDVTRDDTKPFIIQSGDLRVKVLGTSFNFKHYKEDTHAVLAVETGTVTLSAGTNNTTTVHERNYATVDNKSLKTNVYNTLSGQSSWREYKMVFRDEPFNNVLNDLSRRYNVEFEIRGNEIKEYIYTATFDDLSLEDVLKLLKLSSPIDYKIKNLTSNTLKAHVKRKVTIFRK